MAEAIFDGRWLEKSENSLPIKVDRFVTPSVMRVGKFRATSPTLLVK
jgi:hypothetical protein